MRSGRHREEQKNRKDKQVHYPLKHRRAAGTQRDDADQQRQRQQHLLLRIEPQFERLAQRDREGGDGGDLRPIVATTLM